MLNTGRMDNYQRDNISHFILRLAYCANEDLRKWFLTQECALMKYRVDTLDDGQRAAFMASTGLVFRTNKSLVIKSGVDLYIHDKNSKLGFNLGVLFDFNSRK